MQLTFDKNGQMKLVIRELGQDIMSCLDWTTEGEKQVQKSRTNLRLLSANMGDAKPRKNILVATWHDMQELGYSARYALGLERLSDAEKKARRRLLLIMTSAIGTCVFLTVIAYTSALGTAQRPMAIGSFKITGAKQPAASVPAPSSAPSKADLQAANEVSKITSTPDTTEDECNDCTESDDCCDNDDEVVSVHEALGSSLKKAGFILPSAPQSGSSAEADLE